MQVMDNYQITLRSTAASSLIPYDSRYPQPQLNNSRTSGRINMPQKEQHYSVAAPDLALTTSNGDTKPGKHGVDLLNTKLTYGN